MSSNFTPFAFFSDSGLFIHDNENAAPMNPLSSIFAQPRAKPEPATLHTSIVASTSTGGHLSDSSVDFTHSSSNSNVSDSLLPAGTTVLHRACPSNEGPAAFPLPQARKASPAHEGSANLYVASLPASFSDEELYNLFASFGPIVSSKVMYSKASSNGRSVCRGYGFVLFEHEADAFRAQSQMIGHVVGGNKIQVRRAKSGGIIDNGPDASVSTATSFNALTRHVAPALLPSLSTTALSMPSFPTYTMCQSPQSSLFLQAASLNAGSSLSLSQAPSSCGSSMFVGPDNRIYVLLPTNPPA